LPAPGLAAVRPSRATGQSSCHRHLRGRWRRTAGTRCCRKGVAKSRPRLPQPSPARRRGWASRSTSPARG